jgi:hypothetical protein
MKVLRWSGDEFTTRSPPLDETIETRPCPPRSVSDQAETRSATISAAYYGCLTSAMHLLHLFVGHDGD